MKLVERVVLGEISVREFEQLTGFLDAERLGITDRVYTAETARQRRKLARRIGVSVSDSELEPLDISLDELLAVPRSAWSGDLGVASPAPAPVGAGEAPGTRHAFVASPGL